MRNFQNKPTKAVTPAKNTANATAAASKPAAAPEEDFAPGDFVMSIDQSKLATFGNQPGVVLGKSKEKPNPKAKATVYDVRVLHRVLQCAAPLLQRVEVQQSAFPLAELPAPALALVLFWLPLGHAARHAVVCRKFAAAFGDNVSWKRRCGEDVKGIDVEAVFAAEKETSWLAFYRRHAVYRIRIVTVFRHRGGCTLSGDFTIECDPRMSVEAFLERVASHERNRQGVSSDLQPHDPSQLGRHDAQYQIVPNHPHAKPNCEFRQDNRQATIAEAGLHDGAVLEQPERNLCD